jgi:hypothetical protein
MLKSSSVALSLLAWCVAEAAAVYAVEAFHDLATQSFEDRVCDTLEVKVNVL